MTALMLDEDHPHGFEKRSLRMTLVVVSDEIFTVK
jgi:hypothetical protein